MTGKRIKKLAKSTADIGEQCRRIGSNMSWSQSEFRDWLRCRENSPPTSSRKTNPDKPHTPHVGTHPPTITRHGKPAAQMLQRRFKTVTNGSKSKMPDPNCNDDCKTETGYGESGCGNRVFAVVSVSGLLTAATSAVSVFRPGYQHDNINNLRCVPKILRPARFHHTQPGGPLSRPRSPTYDTCSHPTCSYLSPPFLCTVIECCKSPPLPGGTATT